MSSELDQTYADRARRTLLRNALLTGAAMMAPGAMAAANAVSPLQLHRHGARGLSASSRPRD